MSQFQVSGFVKSLKEKTSSYSPIIESITNSIYAIVKTGRTDGYVSIKIIRNIQTTTDNSKSEVIGFEIEDNGIGFDDENTNSFDTAFSDLKQELGGKGIGRFVFLKYFDSISVESVFKNKDKKYQMQKFDFNKNNGTKIISNQTFEITTETDTKTKITFNGLNPQKQYYEKGLDTIAKAIFEKILMYFVDENSKIPQIKLFDDDESISLNNYLNDSDKIIKLKTTKFFLPSDNKKRGEFTVSIFKIFSPGSQNNKISLLAHKIEVEDISMGSTDKIFREQFVEEDKNYIVKAYVTSNFLDDRVSQERTRFDIPQEDPDAFEEVTKKSIIEKTINTVKNQLDSEIKTLSDRREGYVQNFLDNNPHYKSSKNRVDYSTLPVKPNDNELEQAFHKAQYEERVEVKREVNKVLQKADFNKETEVQEVLKRVTQTHKEDLAKYVSERKVILNFLKKALETEDNGSYKKEDLLHSIIHPMRINSDDLGYEDHNLWIIDERLNFTNYISSDEYLISKKRPDIIAVRMDNNYSNPVTIYELKRPGRDDFVDKLSDDPILQIINYRNRISDGQLKMPKGRPINIQPTTPFYGFVICELTQKVRKWLELTKGFNKTPDNDGYFRYEPMMNMYIEVISWDKLVRDANQRNEVFFKKIGL